MIPKVFKEVIDLGDGREISIETGKLAKQAHGSVVVQMGKAMLLCTVVSNYKASDVNFLPLTVDYREKFAAAWLKGHIKIDVHSVTNSALNSSMRLPQNQHVL